MVSSMQLFVTPKPYHNPLEVSGPTPAKAGLKEGEQYLVLSISTDLSDSNETAVCLVNDEGEIWTISNRHLRVVTAHAPNLPTQIDWYS